jgi:hypothetical protein
MIRGTITTLFAFSLGTGCYNDCQKVCNEIADYWEECDRAYDSSQVSDCRDAFSKNADEDADGNTLYDRYEDACRALIQKTENSDGEMVTGLRLRAPDCAAIEGGPGDAFGLGG